MSQIRTKVLQVIDIQRLTVVIIFSVIILFAPQFILNQFIAGSIVNAVLILSLLMFGYQSAFVLCFIPSMVALFSGLLPIILAPMLPFIMFANVIYVSTIHCFTKVTNRKDKVYALALSLASLAKSVFLTGSIYLLSKIIFEGQIAEKLLLMFSWPQLVTAFIGGATAFLIFKFIKWSV